MPDFSDGGSHVVTTPVGPVTVSAATTVTFAAGGDATGTDAAVGPPPVPPTLTEATPGVSSVGSTLSFTGGNPTGGAASSDGVLGAAPAVLSSADHLSISTGTFTGGAGAWNGAPGLDAVGPASLSISGGTFRGGAAASGVGGTALRLLVTGALTIDAGTFTGGAGPVSQGYALGAAVSGTLTVRGGSFARSVAIDLIPGGSVVFQGSGLAYSGGVLSGTITAGGIFATVYLIDVTVEFPTGGWGYGRWGGGSWGSPEPTVTVGGGGSSVTFSA